MSRSIQLFASAVLTALLATAAMPASAGEVAAPEKAAEAGPPASPDPAICEDDASKAAAQMKREAALAELGRRLAAEPKEDGEVRPLNRSGHNYGASRALQPLPEPAPAETAKPH